MDECFAERLVYSDSDNSEGEITRSTKTHTQSTETPTENQLSKDTESDKSDEDDLNKFIKKSKKNAKILSSEDEQVDSIKENDATESKKSVSVRPSICDSDTKSSSDENKNDKEIPIQRKSKKLKKKKRILEKPYESGLNSESDDECEANEQKKHIISNKKQRSSSLSGSSSNSTNSDSNDSGEEKGVQNIEPRLKPIQRVMFA